eukprot:TRINITY_DN130_c0_g2_i1.p1 TRINITY_DN130_c0_g2~~TRINITY_DN130_c0_g2_i1.p1  ORF type:complete len:533 (+),score=259.38 TRINITY_DN130_c0_g2_i1:60-1658(+)
MFDITSGLDSLKAAYKQTRYAMMNVGEIEAKVLDATSSDPWGPSSTQMRELAQLSLSYTNFPLIMNTLWKRIDEPQPNWRHIIKSLSLLEYLIKNGSDQVPREALVHISEIQVLTEFHLVEGEKDHGAAIREKAKSLVELLHDEPRLSAEREKAKRTAAKLSESVSSDGRKSSSSYSSDRSSSSKTYDPYQNQSRSNNWSNSSNVSNYNNSNQSNWRNNNTNLRNSNEDNERQTTFNATRSTSSKFEDNEWANFVGADQVQSQTTPISSYNFAKSSTTNTTNTNNTSNNVNSTTGTRPRIPSNSSIQSVTQPTTFTTTQTTSNFDLLSFDFGQTTNSNNSIPTSTPTSTSNQTQSFDWADFTQANPTPLQIQPTINPKPTISTNLDSWGQIFEPKPDTNQKLDPSKVTLGMLAAASGKPVQPAPIAPAISVNRPLTTVTPTFNLMPMMSPNAATQMGAVNLGYGIVPMAGTQMQMQMQMATVPTLVNPNVGLYQYNLATPTNLNTTAPTPASTSTPALTNYAAFNNLFTNTK